MKREYKALMMRAIAPRKRAKPDYTSRIADNGDFVVNDWHGGVIGRIKKGEFKDPMSNGL